MAKAESPKQTKRRLRAPTQTVRQRAEQAQVVADKPIKVRRFRKLAQTSARPFHRSGKLFHRQPFRFIGHILLPRYFRDAWRELKLVDWPNRKQSRQLTVAVLGFAVVFGAAIAVVDYGLDKVFKAVLLK